WHDLADSDLADPDLAEGEPESVQVAIRLTVTDLAGKPITEIDGGREFYLAATVRDAREIAEAHGVYSAYLDITYDHNLFSVISAPHNPLGFDITFGPEYQNGRYGNADIGGLIDEVGAFQTGFEPLGADEMLLFRTRVVAQGVGVRDDLFTGIAEDSTNVRLDVLANDEFRDAVGSFRTNPADLKPAHDVTLFHPPEAVPESAIDFGGTEITVRGTGEGVITGVSSPSGGGRVEIAGGGLYLVYQPAPNFYGYEAFTYTTSGGRSANVTVVVDAVNDVPEAVDDYYVLDDPGLLSVLAKDGVLANDVDVDGDVITAELREPPAHGTVRLYEDGSFAYTPSSGFWGVDQFTYVARDATTVSREAIVEIQVGTPKASIRLEVTDLDGQPVGQVSSDETLLLRAWVQDLRDESHRARGVFAAFLDVLYDHTLVSPMLSGGTPLGFEIQFGPEYHQSGRGDVLEPGVVNEVGSYQVSFEPLGGAEYLLFEIPFDSLGPRAADDHYTVSYQSIANSLDVLTNDEGLAWSTGFVADPADVSPGSDTLLFDPPVVVPVPQIEYSDTFVQVTNSDTLTIVAVGAPSAGGSAVMASDGKSVVYAPAAGFQGTETFTYTVADGRGRIAQADVTVRVVPSWQNLRNPLDVNGDMRIEPLDALLVINDLNTNGPGRLIDPPTGPPFLDVNGDGFVSPIDALLIINYLNRENGFRGGEGEGEGEGVAREAAVGGFVLAGGDATALPVTAEPRSAPREASKPAWQSRAAWRIVLAEDVPLPEASPQGLLAEQAIADLFGDAAEPRRAARPTPAAPPRLLDELVGWCDDDR
ncbi:MAG: tandem-95 repeat protein, partial [Planctomycetes bacterium]|nr:tandem-95 repeat protein [Planctomycetota bacterium]